MVPRPWHYDGNQTVAFPTLTDVSHPSRILNIRAVGRFLAVGWSDGTVRLMALESNKAVHHIQVCQSDAAKISYIAWASCNISRHKTTASFDKISDGIFKESDLSESNDPVDLPRELTFLEIDTALPKISALPSASAGVGYVRLDKIGRLGADWDTESTRRSLR